ncbi:hypothetical protein [Azospirillum argentinense]
MKVGITTRSFEDRLRQDIPDILYRRFSRREYADLFVQKGIILIRNLTYFRGIEGLSDPRADPMEGKFSSQFPSGTKLNIKKKSTSTFVELGNAVSVAQEIMRPERFFVYCFSSDTHKEQEKFGEFVVKIRSPKALFDRMCSGLLKKEHFSWGGITYYDKNQENIRLVEEIISGEGTPIWMIKSKEFRNECEFRIALERGGVDHIWPTGMAGSRNYNNIGEWEKNLTFKIEMGDIGDIAEILTGTMP